MVFKSVIDKRPERTISELLSGLGITKFTICFKDFFQLFARYLPTCSFLWYISFRNHIRTLSADYVFCNGISIFCLRGSLISVELVSNRRIFLRAEALSEVNVIFGILWTINTAYFNRYNSVLSVFEFNFSFNN